MPTPIPVTPASRATIQAATPHTVAAAAVAIQRGELVAFPTETVYGLGANALDADAVRRIFAAKARPAWNPVIVHVASVADARALTTHWPAQAELLARHCWPGPLTLVLRRAAHVPLVVAAGQDTVGVRIPAHPVAQQLLEAAGLPIAAPSANRFMAVSPTTAQHVVDELGDRVSMVLDGGPCEVGIESTVLDLTGRQPRLLRYGGVSADTLTALLGEPVLDGPRMARAESASESSPNPAPGMVARHYAPRAEAWLVAEPDIDDALAALTVHAAAHAIRVGLLTWRDDSPLARRALAVRELSLATAAPGETGPLLHRTLPPESTAYARQLYATLRTFDEAGCTHLLLEAPPAGPSWDAVRDRLQRASHPAPEGSA